MASTKQHSFWKDIVPCFESGKEYLEWIQNYSSWSNTIPDKYESYFLEIGNAVRHRGYERPISEKKMWKALERSQRTGEMIDVVPDSEFLPGGASEGQCDGWTYHIEMISPEEYFKRQMEEKNQMRAFRFIHRAEWHFAKTMPQIPHWYCLLKECDNKEEFLWFARHIWEHSVPGEFYGRTYKYYYLGRYKYWIMDDTPEQCDLINRDEVKV